MSGTEAILLRTKLHRPPVTRTLVARPRLFERLDRGLDRQLSLVCAPAGFGKTTVVSAWVEGIEKRPHDRCVPVAWLTLEPADSELAVFSSYLVAAIRTVFEDACQATFELLQVRKNPTPAEVATHLSNGIDRLPAGFVLVLDDYQSIRGTAVPELLNELLHHWPYPLHLVLISRISPDLPLTRLRAKGQLIELRSRDLRFGKEETRAFLSRVVETPRSEPLVSVLQEKSEGWAAALRLLALSLGGNPHSSAVTKRLERLNSDLVDYLVDEIIAHQAPAVQTFLLKMSVLDRFCVSLCEAVVGELDPAWNVHACIERLARQELLIIPLDEHEQWYRFHPLLRDVLRWRLATTCTPEAAAELHRRASAWYQQHGMFDQGLEHALRAEDYSEAVCLMEHSVCDLLDQGDWRTMERRLRQFPQEMIQQEVRLLIVKAWILHASWQLDALRSCLVDVDALQGRGAERLEAESRGLLQAQVLFLKAEDAYLAADTERTLRLTDEALRLLPSSSNYLRGGCRFYNALALQAEGAAVVAERNLLEEYYSLRDKTDALALRLLLALCFIHHNAGSLEKLRQAAVTLRQQAENGIEATARHWADFFLGCVYYQWDELETAQRYFEAVTSDHQLAHQACFENAAYGLALVHEARGDSAAALELLAAIGKGDIERLGRIEDGTLSMVARLKLRQGDLDEAFRWADAYTEPVKAHAMPWLEAPHLTKARILLLRNRPADLSEALQILEKLLPNAVRMHNVRYEVEIRVVRALAYKAQYRLSDALEDLERAVLMAAPGGSLRVFLDLGGHLQELLRNLARKGQSIELIHPILAAFPGRASDQLVDDNAAQAQASVFPRLDYPDLAGWLTPREKQVLHYLKDQVTIKEIAYELSISHATAKRHSINIYGKLGVNSRREAVAKAVDLGLFDNGEGAT